MPPDGGRVVHRDRLVVDEGDGEAEGHTQCVVGVYSDHKWKDPLHVRRLLVEARVHGNQEDVEYEEAKECEMEGRPCQGRVADDPPRPRRRVCRAVVLVPRALSGGKSRNQSGDQGCKGSRLLLGDTSQGCGEVLPRGAPPGRAYCLDSLCRGDESVRLGEPFRHHMGHRTPSFGRARMDHVREQPALQGSLQGDLATGDAPVQLRGERFLARGRV
mmetsp:Transcript_17701/g.51458  ORF Transcript_17701/g.51458 Transcript_17701/m.51458 type:complete len:216 (+) Transcript_17701:1893-2540(+)